MSPLDGLVPSGPLGATDPEDRLVTLDILRGLALFGVLMMNLITEFRVSIYEQFVPSVEPGSQLDRLLDGFVRWALDLKAFALFSLLFGVGLAIQFERLERRTRPLYWLGRRLLILLGFGLAHFLLLWNGDILTEYAIAGLLLLPLIREDSAILGFYSFVLFAIYIAMPFLHLPIYWPDTSIFEQDIETANRVYSSGGFAQIMNFSFHELKLMIPLHEFIFPRTLSLMLFGAWIWKSGLLRDLRRHRGAVFATGLLGVAAGLGMTAAKTAGLLAHDRLLGPVFDQLEPTVQAVGYAALVVVAADQPRLGAFLKLFAPLGRMAFTNYICQTLIFCSIFFGYGLGQFGHMSVTAAFALGIAVYTMQMVASALWLHWFRFGPLEWLWRSLMYGQRQQLWKGHLGFEAGSENF